jgi:hypothetical protein
VPKVLDEFDFPPPEGTPRLPAGELRVPQIRVLQVLAAALGPITRTRITERCGYKWPTIVADSLGPSDPSKRQAFYESRSKKTSIGTPLFALGYAREVVVDVDGVSELGIEITPEGRTALAEALKKVGDLPPIKPEE